MDEDLDNDNFKKSFDDYEVLDVKKDKKKKKTKLTTSSKKLLLKKKRMKMENYLILIKYLILII